ncbi:MULTISPECIES: flagellar filament capping protein FliD [unclassified Sphingomonas]|uniref:flagellar filament capping protein FliD n=1 Tax=unclassified Sphingomonas TaxID=196159 RepID=UPI002865A5C9|nr:MULTISPECIES: flagellar filament capping protein FliD [unclassified Sphingomonas]MDR6114079.1 flagellar hook-associated protein 2 [Sphingomonas sp. SORGH_AS_0789]MDR6148561.1 flagellar hook-associated protein 2 [Sphingomonas sp. SORGH_AS_0742]
MTDVSVTASSTSTTTSTTASTTKTAAQALFNSLQTGSGIDLSSVVPALIEAQFAAKTAALKTQSDTLTSQISDVSSIKSSITDFASALASLAKGGTLATQAVSSDPNSLSVTTSAGAKLAGMSKSITINALATAQVSSTKSSYSSTASLGTGSLSIKVGSKDAISVTIDSADSTPSALAAKVNAANTGVKAAVITDSSGNAYLSFSSATGKDNSFTITASEGDTAGLSRLNVGNNASGTSTSSTAANASITMDGVTVERSSNTVSDLVQGVTMTLSAVTSKAVSLTGSSPTTALSNVVSNFVSTFNDNIKAIAKATDPITGSLRADPAARSLAQTLRTITTTKLVPGDSAAGAPLTLADLGVKTEKDGTLTVDQTRLSQALSKYPDVVEKMFRASDDNVIGLSAQMNTIQMSSTSSIYGLTASYNNLTQQKSDTALAQTKLADSRQTASDALTARFAQMNSRVTAYKSVQSFMDQQVKMWTKGN